MNLQFVAAVLSLVSLTSASTSAWAAEKQRPVAAPYQAVNEPWKGPLGEADLQFSLMSGLALIDPKAGLALLGAFAKKVIDPGWAPDLSNQVFFEVMAGPALINGNAPFTYSLHLRWDFRYDDYWTVYGLGGLGGNITGRELGDRFMLFPRFGLGTIYYASTRMAIRSELSHEYILVGVTFSY